MNIHVYPFNCHIKLMNIQCLIRLEITMLSDTGVFYSLVIRIFYGIILIPKLRNDNSLSLQKPKEQFDNFQYHLLSYSMLKTKTLSSRKILLTRRIFISFY